MFVIVSKFCQRHRQLYITDHNSKTFKAYPDRREPNNVVILQNSTAQMTETLQEVKTNDDDEDRNGSQYEENVT